MWRISNPPYWGGRCPHLDTPGVSRLPRSFRGQVKGERVQQDETGRDGVAVALEHVTGRTMGALMWLDGPALDVLLGEDGRLRLAETPPGTRPEGLVARLHRAGETYEIEVIGPGPVWINGALAGGPHRLTRGDAIEFGEAGPICRLRVYSSAAPKAQTLGEIFGDTAAYLKVSRQRPARRAGRAVAGLLRRLALHSTLLFRVTVLAALGVLALVVWQQAQITRMQGEALARAEAQIDSVSGALVATQAEALRPADLAALRESLENRLDVNRTRLEELESRSTAGARVVGQAARHVVFLQGMYGFREPETGRMLRQRLGADGVPLRNFQGRPLLTLEGEGPVVELKFTGTGFFLAGSGQVVTNRHVALPWEQNTANPPREGAGLEPVMLRFLAYLPGQPAPVRAEVVRASGRVDLALLSLPEVDAPGGLPLAEAPPEQGEEVIVMGYPTGMRSMLAQSGPAFIEGLQAEGITDFWMVAERLAQAGFIAPLASRGIVGQATPAALVYDAETTHGGSGGPVLDLMGRVVAVNAAILPEYGGSNLGVPVAELRALLDGQGG